MLLSFSVFGLMAQDIQFSQFYSVTTYMNPAFAGSTHNPRGMVHERVQWPGLDARYSTTLVSADHYFHKYNSGAGLYFLKDRQGGNTLTTTEVHAQYAYELPISSTVVVRAGLEAGFASRYVNYANLTFPTQFNSSGPNGTAAPDDLFGKQRKSYADVAAGGLLYTDNLWAGISAHHLNTPNQSFYDTIGRLPMKLDIIGGYKFHLVHGKHMAYLHDSPQISISPTVHYKSQGKSDQLDLGVYGIYDQLLVGLWYRGIPVKHYQAGLPNVESIVLLGGWVYKDLTFGFSYDMTISRLTKARTAGAYELNITYTHHQHSKHHKQLKRLPCPDLYRH